MTTGLHLAALAAELVPHQNGARQTAKRVE